ncbi:MAG TPA: response regulator [Longimicrobiales bacterium]
MANILVVEDDEAVSSLVARQLERHGYDVRTAAGPLEALEALRDWDVHLLLMDMGLPGMHGLDLVHLLRGANLGIPAIAITGEQLDQDVAQAAGFLHLLIKPFGIDELLKAVRDVLP